MINIYTNQNTMYFIKIYRYYMSLGINKINICNYIFFNPINSFISSNLL